MENQGSGGLVFTAGHSLERQAVSRTAGNELS